MASPTDRPAPLDKAYDPHAIEQRLYETWERAGYFQPSGSCAPFCIMIPPPNVTGSLHMGHAFNNTVMDTLTRWHRMRGDNSLWQPGTDHAGIATQMVVERQLNAEKKTRHDLGREKFIERVWTWKAESGGNITRQLRRMGASLDWSRERFTLDPEMSKAVTEVFVRLHEEGLIYRGKRLVNWDPVLHTAVSDLEVVSEEEQGSMWHIRYPIQGTKEFLVVATTRPETLLGDTAVAVNPDDERYIHLVDKHVEVPLTGRTIPIIADDYVDKEFGSGCVKITPAHDFNDYEVGIRHKLPLLSVLESDASVSAAPALFMPPGSKFTFPDGRVLQQAGEDEYEGFNVGGFISTGIGSRQPDLMPNSYRGLDRFAARKKIVADLDAAGLLAEVKPHKLMVPRGDRSGAVIEPLLTDQWYVKIAPLAEPAIKAVEDGRIKFIPENWNKTYYEWMKNIQDWCISRQIWWGHRIPAWYDDEGKFYVGRTEEEVRAKHNLGTRSLKQDDDVLDTWFSSALWPFSTLGWPEQTKELKTFYPTSVLVTGFDIIFFWVARMIMMGLKFTGEVPFKEVYIHGLVRDAHGQKMSKSKGNVLDPIDLIDGIDIETLVKKRTTGLMRPSDAPKIEKATRKEFPEGIPAYGTDALRFTFASLATQGRDIKFDLGRIDGYRNFCNKLWNAARFVLMNTEGQDCGVGDAPVRFSPADRWIQSRLQQVIVEVETGFADYRFDLAAQTIYGFIWDEYCSWYVELTKQQIALGDAEAVRGTRKTLIEVLEASLRLLHPIMPFITEEIWLRVAPLAGIDDPSIMRRPYPRTRPDGIDADAVAAMQWVQKFINGIRNIRGEYNVSPAQTLETVWIEDAADADKKLLNDPYLQQLITGNLARVAGIKTLASGETAPPSAVFLLGGMKIHVPLGSIIDKKAELLRLGKEIEKFEKELTKATNQLANANFVANAPPQVVEEMKNRVREFETTISKLRAQQKQIGALNR